MAFPVHPSAGPLCPTLLFYGDPDQWTADELMSPAGTEVVPAQTLAASAAAPDMALVGVEAVF